MFRGSSRLIASLGRSILFLGSVAAADPDHDSIVTKFATAAALHPTAPRSRPCSLSASPPPPPLGCDGRGLQASSRPPTPVSPSPTPAVMTLMACAPPPPPPTCTVALAQEPETQTETQTQQQLRAGARVLVASCKFDGAAGRESAETPRITSLKTRTRTGRLVSSPPPPPRLNLSTPPLSTPDPGSGPSAHLFHPSH
jgi:hypothetical protein